MCFEKIGKIDIREVIKCFVKIFAYFADLKEAKFKTEKKNTTTPLEKIY